MLRLTFPFALRSGTLTAFGLYHSAIERSDMTGATLKRDIRTGRPVWADSHADLYRA